MTNDPKFDAELSQFLEDPEALSDEQQRELEARLDEHINHAVEAFDMIEPSNDFDRALFDRLDEIDREKASSPIDDWKQRWRAFFTLPRLGVAAGALAAAAVLMVVVTGESPNELSKIETQEIAQNLELYRNLDVIEHLDVLDDLDVIEQLELEDAG